MLFHARYSEFIEAVVEETIRELVERARELRRDAITDDNPAPDWRCRQPVEKMAWIGFVVKYCGEQCGGRAKLREIEIGVERSERHRRRQNRLGVVAGPLRRAEIVDTEVRQG